MIINYIKIAWKVLMRRKLYAFVTLFGISLTLTLLYTTMIFMDHLLSPQGTEEKFDRAIFSHTLNLMNEAKHNNSNNAYSFAFVEKYAYPMKTPELVSTYTNAILMDDQIFAYKKEKRIPLTIRYTDGHYWQFVDLEFIEGRGYTQEEILKDDRIVVLDRKARDVYFDGAPCYGKSVQIRGISHRVVGVVENVDGLRFTAFSNLWAPYTHTSHHEWNYFGHLQIGFLAKDKADIPKIQNEFNTFFSKFEFIGDNYDSAYAQAMPMTLDIWGREDTFRATLGQFVSIEDAPKIFFGLLILFYLFLPGLNLISLNSTRIMERFPEIGARKAFGATTLQLALQFMTENIIITLLGAILAAGLTWICIIAFNNAHLFANSQISPGYHSFLIGTLAALLLAVLSGLTPSIRLAKTKIVDTLKSTGK